MAQLVEQRIRNAQAVGSSPTSSSSRVFVRTLGSFIRLTASYIASQIYSVDSECYLLRKFQGKENIK